MRKPIYDHIIKEGLERIAKNEDFHSVELKAVFKDILLCEDEEKLNNYYARMDEFFGANNTDILLISADQLAKGEIK